MPTHYLNQCWIILNWYLINKLQWNLILNSNPVTEKNTFEIAVCKMGRILSAQWRPSCSGFNVTNLIKIVAIYMWQTETGPRQDNIIHNYMNPGYGVATICHQVRCLRWGHPSLLYTAKSLLIWYKMFCMRDISYRLMWMKFLNILSVYAHSGTHRHFNWWTIVVLT